MNQKIELWIPAAKGNLGCTMSRVSCVADKNVCVCVCAGSRILLHLEFQ